MDMNWHVAMFITGCLITSSFVCKAENDNTLRETTMQFTPIATKHNQKAISSEALLQVFENLDKASSASEKEYVNLLNDYKGKLKSLLSVQLSDSFQIGLDQVKSGPLNVEQSEIVDINLHLLPKMNEDLKSKGYGLEIRFKLD